MIELFRLEIVHGRALVLVEDQFIFDLLVDTLGRLQLLLELEHRRLHLIVFTL